MTTDTATYCPEDNKLRLYAAARLDAETYARAKSLNFKWAPKQELFVCPRWTPQAEDFLLELCGDVGDEDYSPEERAADRAERFQGYQGKRLNEAIGHADRFDAGPSVFGHQSRARAERQASRHDRIRGRALTQWDKADYWQHRTESVIAHALHKTSPELRRARVKLLETELRHHAERIESYARLVAKWEELPTLDGANEPIPYSRESYGVPKDSKVGAKMAYLLANNSGERSHYTHPRNAERTECSLHTLLTDSVDPITPTEAAALWLEGRDAPGDGNSYSERWARHYELRLSYERAMLANEGGSATDVEMIPGGFIGKHQIDRVNKSNVSGKPVSVVFVGGSRPRNIERLGADVYRAPTDEEIAEFEKSKKERKAEAKANAAPVVPLINPTDEDAERLQGIWNAREQVKQAKAKKENRTYGDFQPSTVLRLTQAQYSANSKGAHSHLSTIEVDENLTERNSSYYGGEGTKGRVTVFKIRKSPAGGSFGYYKADRVIVITDKPQKPIPFDEVERVKSEQPSEATVAKTFGRLLELLRGDYESRNSPEAQQLYADARYVGWMHRRNCDWQFTEAGTEAIKRHDAQHAAPVGLLF